MNALWRSMRRLILRWQLRNLEYQAESIIEARQHALARLLDIERERLQKKEELWRNYAGGLSTTPSR